MTVRRYDTLRAGAEAASSLLAGCCHLHPVTKAINLGNKAGFDRAVAEFASALRRLAEEPELEAIQEAIKVLDVEWRGTTAAQRSALVTAAMVAAGRALAMVPSRHEVVVAAQARDVVAAGRDDARRFLTIGADFNSVDKRIVEHLKASHVLYVTDEYGRRIDAFGKTARDIVAEGAELGIGRGDIGGRLRNAATEDLASRSKAYWEVVAGAFTARGRTFGQISGYAEAGIERFRVEAVLDEATTNICRMLHGSEFTVASGLKAFADAEGLGDPEGIKGAAPWVRETRNADGTTELWVKKGAERVSIGRVVESAVGRADETGRFSGRKSAEEMGGLGVGPPPYHGLCRSTTVPVL